MSSILLLLLTAQVDVTGDASQRRDDLVSSRDDGLETVRTTLDQIITNGSRSAVATDALSAYQRTGILQPGSRHFTYAVRGATRALCFEYQDRDSILTCYRLDDGSNLVKMDGRGVTIATRGAGENWLNICQPISRFHAPLYYERRMSLEDRLKWFRDEFLAPNGKFYNALARGDGWITVDSSENVCVLELYETDFTHNPRISMTIDTADGLYLLKWRENDGTEDPARWTYIVEIENTYEEVVPGLKMLVSGSYRLTNTGAVAKDGRTQHSSGSIEFTETSFGTDITVPMTVRELPIEPWAVVEDHRVNPHVVRNFAIAKSPVDSIILQLILDGKYTVP